MFLKQIQDPSLAQYAYLIGCQRTGEALLIDPERDIDRYLEIAAENNLTITAVAETHIHADFLSGVRQFVETQPGVTAYLSAMGGTDWNYVWGQSHERVRLVNHKDVFKIGKIMLTVIHTPGHTPEHISFIIEDQGGGANEPMAVVTGDFVFVGDVGRPDLLETAAGVIGTREPSARSLYRSLNEFGKLPDFLQILPGHGAGSSCGKALGAIPSSTVGYERRFNSAFVLALSGNEEAFVKGILSGQPEPAPYFSLMKKENRIGPEILQVLPRPMYRSSEEIVKRSQAGQSIILDTRQDRMAFMRSHIKGSLFAPHGSFFTTVAGSYIKPGDAIDLVVESADEVPELVRSLVRIGLDKVSSYTLVSELTGEIESASFLTETTVRWTGEVASLLQQFPEASVLDVRMGSEFSLSSFSDAIHIPYTRIAVEKDSIPTGKMIVHCASGQRAAIATAYLEHLGAEVIYANGSFDDLLGTNSSSKITTTSKI